MEGWIKLHRSLQDHWLWTDKPFSKGQAWIDMLLMANHDTGRVVFGSEIITVERGSFITSETKLMDRWGWSKAKLRAYHRLLEEDGMISKKTDRKKTTITIVNYGGYQELKTTKEPPADHGETTEKPQTEHKQEVKNEKNEKKIKREVFTPPAVDDVMGYCNEKGYQVDAERFVDFYSSKGWMVGKNKMKDWKATVRNWARQEKEAEKPKVKKNAFAANCPQRNYNMDDLERQLLSR